MTVSPTARLGLQRRLGSTDPVAGGGGGGDGGGGDLAVGLVMTPAAAAAAGIWDLQGPHDLPDITAPRGHPTVAGRCVSHPELKLNIPP